MKDINFEKLRDFLLDDEEFTTEDMEVILRAISKFMENKEVQNEIL